MCLVDLAWNWCCNKTCGILLDVRLMFDVLLYIALFWDSNNVFHVVDGVCVLLLILVVCRFGVVVLVMAGR